MLESHSFTLHDALATRNESLKYVRILSPTFLLVPGFNFITFGMCAVTLSM